MFPEGLYQVVGDFLHCVCNDGHMVLVLKSAALKGMGKSANDDGFEGLKVFGYGQMVEQWIGGSAELG
jgi:hypothetical protein